MKVTTFSYSSDKLLGRIMTPVKLINPLTLESMDVIALWDTGATVTAISSTASEFLHLKKMGKIVANGVYKSKKVNVYYALLHLSESVRIPILPSEFCIRPHEGVDCVIGMDVISKGDFTISNYQGHTRFCFRIPSGGDIILR